MDDKKSIKEINYQFRGNLNTDWIMIVAIFGFPIGFALYCLSASFGKYGQFFSISLILSAIIYFIAKFDSESNLILFTNEGFIHYKKGGSDKFSYSEINKLQITIPHKGHPYVHLKLRKKQFTFSLEKKNYSNFTYKEFAEHLLTIDSTILIIEYVNSEKHRYSIENGEILKTRI